jgi:polyphosphate kinase 2 (PPK2 family)
VLFEGWDASGKGGAIKRLVRPFDLRHVRVAQFSAPTPDEKRYHYLQRFWAVLPGFGGMTILDRSWYGRVLVERVEGFASEAAIEEMLAQTDSEGSPWHLVEAENKKHARVKVVEPVIDRIEDGMRKRGIEPPSIGK